MNVMSTNPLFLTYIKKKPLYIYIYRCQILGGEEMYQFRQHFGFQRIGDDLGYTDRLLVPRDVPRHDSIKFDRYDDSQPPLGTKINQITKLGYTIEGFSLCRQ